MQKINVMKFALAWGITFGIYVMVLGWLAMSGWGIAIVQTIASLYVGYGPSFVGGIIGGLYAFVDWTIGIAIVGWLYNAMLQNK
jgi:hypothetical protein